MDKNGVGGREIGLYALSVNDKRWPIEIKLLGQVLLKVVNIVVDVDVNVDFTSEFTWA